MMMPMNGKTGFIIPSPLQELSDPLFEKAGIKVFAKRDDLIDPEISGNKWRKLKYNFRQAGNLPILTFGGAFSNHIAATAALCGRSGKKSVGVIRGEKPAVLNTTLKKAEEYGMLLHFVSRPDYRLKEEPDFIEDLHDLFGDFYLIPEGGANIEGVRGSAEIVKEIEIDFDFMISAVGTGTTLAGMLASPGKNQNQIGIPVLKNGGYLKKNINNLLKDFCNDGGLPFPKKGCFLLTDYHHGGYARISNKLIDFIRYFYRQHGIKTDPVYSGKSAFALYDLIEKGKFPSGSKVVWLHCGGLQGIEGMEKRYGFKLFDSA